MINLCGIRVLSLALCAPGSDAADCKLFFVIQQKTSSSRTRGNVEKTLLRFGALHRPSVWEETQLGVCHLLGTTRKGVDNARSFKQWWCWRKCDTEKRFVVLYSKLLPVVCVSLILFCKPNIKKTFAELLVLAYKPGAPLFTALLTLAMHSVAIRRAPRCVPSPPMMYSWLI